MQHEILYQPSYALLKLELAAGESVQAESGAMVGMSPTIEIKTAAKGGLFKGLKRAVLGGESFFMNTFTAERAGEITFAPTLPGDITAMKLSGERILAQSGAYLAGSEGLDIDTKWGGAKTFFSREGFFLLSISGTGDLFLSSYGGIHRIDLEQGQSYIVDTGHVVAFDEGVRYEVRRVGGLKSTLFSGEGLVCELTGPGSVWVQTRSEDSFVSWIRAHMPKKE